MAGFAWLGAAIAAEVLATLSLKASQGFTRPLLAALVVTGYGVAFFCLSLSLRELPIAIAYAAWAGVGTAAVALLGWLVYGESLQPGAVAGIALVTAGAALLGAFSKPGP